MVSEKPGRQNNHKSDHDLTYRPRNFAKLGFMFFKKKPNDIQELTKILLRNTRSGAQQLVHRQVYYRQIVLHLSPADLEKWQPYLEELRSELKKKLTDAIPARDGPYAPELLFKKKSGATSIAGFFEIKPREDTF